MRDLNILHSICSSGRGDQAVVRDRAFRLKVYLSVSPVALVPDLYGHIPSEPR